MFFALAQATFSDCRAEEAVKKKHSTTSEAIQIAHQMNAQRLILTHFSQRSVSSLLCRLLTHSHRRYPSTPPLPSQCLELQSAARAATDPLRVVLAYDFMRLTLRDCLWAHAMNLPLTIAFPPEEEEDVEGEGRGIDHEEREIASQKPSKRTQAPKAAGGDRPAMGQSKKVKS